MAEANHSLHHAYLRARMGVAVMTLARQRAIARVKEQLRATELKVAHSRIERSLWQLRSISLSIPS